MNAATDTNIQLRIISAYNTLCYSFMNNNTNNNNNNNNNSHHLLLHYTGEIPQQLDTDVHSVVTEMVLIVMYSAR